MSFIDFFENSRPCQIVALGSPGLASTCCSPKVPGLGFCAAGSLAWQEDPMPCFLQGFAEIFLPWSRKQICSTLLWPPVRCWDMSKISQAFSMKLRQNEIFYPESSSDLKWPLWASSTFLPQELNRKGWERRGRRNYIRPRIRKDRQEMRVTDTWKKSSPHSVECRWMLLTASAVRLLCWRKFRRKACDLPTIPNQGTHTGKITTLRRSQSTYLLQLKCRLHRGRYGIHVQCPLHDFFLAPCEIPRTPVGVSKHLVYYVYRK